MLKAGLFERFKGATTLLLWGDKEGMATLQRGFSALRDGEREDFTIEGVERPLTVCSATPQGEQSTLRTDETGFRWECSHDIIALAADLVEPLLGAGAAHQFMDVDGLAEQVIIARDE